MKRFLIYIMQKELALVDSAKSTPQPPDQYSLLLIFFQDLFKKFSSNASFNFHVWSKIDGIILINIQFGKVENITYSL